MYEYDKSHCYNPAIRFIFEPTFQVVIVKKKEKTVELDCERRFIWYDVEMSLGGDVYMIDLVLVIMSCIMLAKF